MPERYAIIGGTGVYDPEILDDIRKENVKTQYGNVEMVVGRHGTHEVAFLPRHGEGHSVPPHRINYRANIYALKEMEVSRVLATSAVGSINKDMKPGDLVLLDDFLDFTKKRTYTFFEGGDEYGVRHTDFTEPYCPELREILFNTARELGFSIHQHGTYVCAEGPRFETPAEIKMFSMLGGDVVGMTNVPEVVLAHELGLCYAVVALVTNYAAGISPTHLTHEEVLDVMKGNIDRIKRVFNAALERIPGNKNCRC